MEILESRNIGSGILVWETLQSKTPLSAREWGFGFGAPKQTPLFCWRMGVCPWKQSVTGRILEIPKFLEFFEK